MASSQSSTSGLIVTRKRAQIQEQMEREKRKEENHKKAKKNLRTNFIEVDQSCGKIKVKAEVKEDPEEAKQLVATVKEEIEIPMEECVEEEPPTASSCLNGEKVEVKEEKQPGPKTPTIVSVVGATPLPEDNQSSNASTQTVLLASDLDCTFDVFDNELQGLKAKVLEKDALLAKMKKEMEEMKKVDAARIKILEETLLQYQQAKTGNQADSDSQAGKSPASKDQSVSTSPTNVLRSGSESTKDATIGNESAENGDTSAVAKVSSSDPAHLSGCQNVDGDNDNGFDRNNLRGNVSPGNQEDSGNPRSLLCSDTNAVLPGFPNHPGSIYTSRNLMSGLCLVGSMAHLIPDNSTSPNQFYRQQQPAGLLSQQPFHRPMHQQRLFPWQQRHRLFSPGLGQQQRFRPASRGLRPTYSPLNMSKRN